jgi:hypothetical protein
MDVVAVIVNIVSIQTSLAVNHACCTSRKQPMSLPPGLEIDNKVTSSIHSSCCSIRIERMVLLIIKAGGQTIYKHQLDEETYLEWTTNDVRRTLRKHIKNFDKISKFWHFSPNEFDEKVSELTIRTEDNEFDSFQLDMYYDRASQPNASIEVFPPRMRQQPGLKRGEKPYPLLWEPPLIERRDTGSERGMGLFALHSIAPGTFITEYGGRILSHDEAVALDPCDKTHILPMYQGGPVFDGRQQGAYTYAWYASQGLTAQFANDKKGTGKKGNVDYKSQPGDYPGGEHLTPSGEKVPVAVRKFLVAKKEILAGEELLLLNYGPGHQKFEQECEEAKLRE